MRKKVYRLLLLALVALSLALPMIQAGARDFGFPSRCGSSCSQP